MKLFSRKALVAGAAAVALSFAGTSVATAEPATNTGGSSVSDLFGGSSFSDSKNDTNDDADSTEDNGNGEGDGNGNEKPKEENGSSDIEAGEITAWISVFTAVIGALGALFSFASKYLGFKLL